MATGHRNKGAVLDIPLAKKSRKAPQDAALLAAACGIVSSEGLTGLTLRPLAEALGVSVTVLTSHYGARADVVAAVCNAAREQDAQLMAQWRATLAALDTLSPAIAAELAETMLEELATHHRGLSLLYLELLHACTWDAALQPVFAPWQAERRAFWQAFGERAGMAPGLLACGWWHGYILAELAYGLVLGPVTAYRSLRRLCLRRLFAGGLASRADAGDAELFALLLARMQLESNADAAGSAGREPPWAVQAARVCGRWLAAQGVHGLTHRAIAAEIGIAHTTLSYRYPAQRDLVIAGLESIIAHIRFAVDADSLTELQRLRVEGDGKQLDLARANFAVAIAAARMPELAAYTADMRSRRGNNLVKVFMKYLPQAHGIDALCAQVISMGLTGLTNTEPPGTASDQTVAAAFGAAAGWLQQNQ
jgi:AcrR family transcriptional regulator